jgi:putative membrane protein
MFDVGAVVSAWPLGDCHWSGWWVFAPLGWFLVIASFFIFIRFVVFRRRPWGAWGYGPGGGRMSAAEVLERRFAEGELTAEQYRKGRAILRDEPASGPRKRDTDAD